MRPGHILGDQGNGSTSIERSGYYLPIVVVEHNCFGVVRSNASKQSSERWSEQEDCLGKYQCETMVGNIR
jgi:hypothetical protein